MVSAQCVLGLVLANYQRANCAERAMVDHRFAIIEKSPKVWRTSEGDVTASASAMVQRRIDRPAFGFLAAFGLAGTNSQQEQEIPSPVGFP
jgi:hypothetical protein